MAAAVEEVAVLYAKNAKGDNDKCSKIRERVFNQALSVPEAFLEHPEHGAQWEYLQREMKTLAHTLAQGNYASVSIKPRGGRKYNYDAIFKYVDSSMAPIGEVKVEYKCGATTIQKLPQILSLQAKFPMFSTTYDTWYYQNWLDKYLATDPGITETKPSLEDYLGLVTNTEYDVLPLFQQLKDREDVQKKNKAAIVNDSIREYLKLHGPSLNLEMIVEKIRDTQLNKKFVLWHEGNFHVDSLTRDDLAIDRIGSIRNGNVVELFSKTARYDMLLRWRNHKGVLNPAWQISCKRLLRAAL
jgi:hypothetical protein